jgi:hypothetical protein
MIVPSERSAIAPHPVQLKKLLLAEGATPTHFFEALAKKLNLSEQIEIRNYGGIDKLGDVLKLLAGTPDFKANVTSLGVTRDAENSFKAALDSALGFVKAAKIGSTVKVAFYIFPYNDGKTPGMIETLCVRSVLAKPVYECIEKFIDCARGKGVNLPTGVVIAKHQLQVYLASQEEVQMMPGIASSRQAFPFDDPVFSGLTDFLKSL